MAVFKFRDGFQVGRDINAEAVANELTRISGKERSLTAPAVVEAAKSKESVLHPIIFRIGEKQAAHEYRLNIARKLIRAVYVIKEDGEPEQPVWVHVPTPIEDGPNRGDYQPTSVVVQRPDAFAAALSELQRRLSSARQAVVDLQRIAGESDDSDRLMLIGMAVKALETAGAAVSAIH